MTDDILPNALDGARRCYASDNWELGAPHANLHEALGVASVPPAAWHEQARIENRFNRILLYRANLVQTDEAVFFWMA